MAAQQTVSNLAKMLGEKIADAHKQAKDAPVDKGFVSLPGGIRNGVFQLREAYIALIDKGDDKGKPYFRARPAGEILAAGQFKDAGNRVFQQAEFLHSFLDGFGRRLIIPLK